MPTRNVVLSERQQPLVETLVQSGRYQNAGEVLREGLRLIDERERLEGAKLKSLKQLARQGWADVSAPATASGTPAQSTVPAATRSFIWSTSASLRWRQSRSTTPLPRPCR